MKKISKKGRAGARRVRASKPAARELHPHVQRYLATLRRIPVEVRQSMATREFDMLFPESCVCGWAIRDAILAAFGTEYMAGWDSVDDLTARFGGRRQDWLAIFAGVLPEGHELMGYPGGQLPAIEEAFTIAVAETVR